MLGDSVRMTAVEGEPRAPVWAMRGRYLLKNLLHLDVQLANRTVRLTVVELDEDVDDFVGHWEMVSCKES